MKTTQLVTNPNGESLCGNIVDYFHNTATRSGTVNVRMHLTVRFDTVSGTVRVFVKTSKPTIRESVIRLKVQIEEGPEGSFWTAFETRWLDWACALTIQGSMLTPLITINGYEILDSMVFTMFVEKQVARERDEWYGKLFTQAKPERHYDGSCPDHVKQLADS